MIVTKPGRWLPLLALAAFTLAGCEDNPADSTDGSGCGGIEHVDADGVRVDGEATLVRQFEGDVTGEIELEVDETLTGLRVIFLDEDEEDIVLPSGCDEWQLRWVDPDTTVARVTRNADDPWSIDVHGRAEGKTSVRLRIWHGDHADFTSLELPIHVGHDEHEIEIDGLRLRVDDVEIASQIEGVVTGQITAIDGETTAISVSFLDEKGDEIPPSELEDELELVAEVDDDTIANVTVPAPRAGNPWMIQVEGLLPGTTTVALRLEHEDHVDFESLDLPLEVVEAPGAEALMILEGCNPQATWAYDPEEGPDDATGPLLGFAGETRSGLEVHYLRNFTSGGGETGDEEWDVIPLNGDGYRVRATVADPAVLDVRMEEGADGLRLDLDAHAAGATTVVLELLVGGRVVHTSGAIPCVVVDEAAALDPDPDFLFKVNGIWTVLLRDGASTTDGCGRTLPGEFVVDEAELTALYGVRHIAEDGEDCDQISLSSSRYRMVFLFDDPCVARVVNHPIHWGERTIFHFQGMTAGETTVRMVLLDGDALSFVTPPMPVRVPAP